MSWLDNAIDITEEEKQNETWLDNAVDVTEIKKPDESWLKNAIDITEPAKPTMRPSFRKALLNRGVDPDTMTVIRPVDTMGFFEKVVRSFKAGDARMKMDWRMSEAATSDSDVYDQYRQEEILYEQAVAMNPIAEDEANNVFEKAFFGAADSLAGMIYAMGGKIAGSTVGLGIGTAITALTPIPGDEVAVGGAFLAKLFGRKLVVSTAQKLGIRAGGLIGGAAPFYKQGQGALYRDMREMGLDHETAKTWAEVGAVFYAGIEFINDYIPARKIAGKFIPGLNAASKPLVSKTIAEAMRKMAMQWGKSTIAEASEEFWQEVSNETFKNLAALSADRPDLAIPVDETFKKGLEAMVQAVGPSMVLGAAPSVGFGIRQAKVSRVYQQLHAMGIDKNTAKYMTAEFTGVDKKVLDDVLTLPEEQRLEALVEGLDERNQEVALEVLLDTEIPMADRIKITQSLDVKAAYLAYKYEGIEGVNKINEALSADVSEQEDGGDVDIVSDATPVETDVVDGVAAEPKVDVTQDVDTEASDDVAEMPSTRLEQLTQDKEIEADVTETQTDVVDTTIDKTDVNKIDKEVALAVLRELQPKRGIVPKTERVTSRFRPGSSLSAEELADLQSDYETWAKKANIEPTSLEYHVGEGNAVVWSPYGTEDRLVGQFIGDIFAVSHFAPKSGRSGVDALTDLLHTSTPVVFAVPDKLADQLERIGFLRSNVIVPMYFRGEVQHKNILANKAVTPDDTKKLAAWWLAEAQINGLLDQMRHSATLDAAREGTELILKQSNFTSPSTLQSDNTLDEAKQTKSEQDVVVIQSPAETPYSQTVDKLDTKTEPITPRTKAQETIERTEKTGIVSAEDLRLGDTVEVVNVKNDKKAMFVYQGLEGEHMQFSPLEGEETLDTVFGKEIVTTDNTAFKYNRITSATVERLSPEDQISESKVRTAEQKIQRRTDKIATDLLSPNIEDALYNDADEKQKAILEKIALKQDADVNDIVDQMEGAILHDDNVIVLARNASEFTAAHEEFHKVFSVVMNVPKYKQAVNNYLARVYNQYHNMMNADAKKALGEKFAEELEAWHETKEVTADMVELQEILARLVERLAGQMAAKEGTDMSKLTTQKPSGRLYAFLNAIDMPEGLRRALESMLFAMSKVWNTIKNSKLDKTLYLTLKKEAGALPRATKGMMDIMNDLLTRHDADKWLSQSTRDSILKRTGELRLQFLSSFTNLYKAGKLEHVDKTAKMLKITPEQRLEQMATHSANIMSAMAQGAAIAEARQARVEMAREFLKTNITTEHINKLAMDYASKFKSGFNKQDIFSTPDDVQLSSDLVKFYTEIALPRAIDVMSNRLGYEGGKLTAKTLNGAVREISRILTPSEAVILIGNTDVKGLHNRNMMNYRRKKHFSNEIVEWVSSKVDVDFNDSKTVIHQTTYKYGIPVSTPAFVWGWMVRHVGGKTAKGEQAIKHAEAENQKLITTTTDDFEQHSFDYNLGEVVGELKEAGYKPDVPVKSDVESREAFIKEFKSGDPVEVKKIIDEVRKNNPDAADIIGDIQFSGTKAEQSSVNEKRLPNMMREGTGLLDRASKAAVSNVFKQVSGLNQAQLLEMFGRESIPQEHWINEAKKRIGKRKTEYVLNTMIPNESSVPLKLAMLIVVGGRNRNAMNTPESMELAAEIRNNLIAFTTDIGRGLNLTQWIYNRTPEGMLLAINAMEHDKRSSPEQVKALNKKIKMLKDHIKKLEAGLKKDVESDPKGIEDIARKGIKDKTDHPDVDPEGDAEPERTALGKALQSRLQDVVGDIVDKSFGDIAKSFGLDDMQFSGVRGEGLNLKNVLIEVHQIFKTKLTELSGDLDQLDVFAYAKNRAVVIDEFLQRKDVRKIVSNMTPDQRKLLKKGLDGTMLNAREGVMKELAFWYQSIAGNQDILDEQVTDEKAAINLHAQKFAAMIENEAKDKKSVIDKEKIEDGLKRCVGALFTIVKERSLVESGRDSISLDSPQKINDRLDSLIKNREELAEVWEEAKLLLKDIVAEEEMRYIEPRIEEFFANSLGPTTWGRQHLQRAVANYLRFLSVKNYPKAWQEVIKSNRTKMMDIARLHINDAMTEDGNITPESITRGAAMLARKFVNEFVVYNDISLDNEKTVESIQFLEQSAQKEIENWLDFNAQTFVDVKKEAKALARNIVNDTKKTDFKSIGDLNIRQKMAFVLRELGVVSKVKAGKKNPLEVFFETSKLLKNAKVIPSIIEEMKSELRKAIRDAESSVKENRTTLPATIGLINELSVTLKAISNSEALQNYAENLPLTIKDVDKLITAALKVISQHGVASATMRSFVTNLYQDKETAITGLRNAVFEHLGLDDPDSPLAGTAMLGNIARIIQDRIGARYETTRKAQLDALLGYLDRSPADKEDFVDRIIKRIRMGALSDEENITRMAEYMMTPVLDDETRARLERMVNNIFKRGDVLIERWRKRSGLTDDTVEQVAIPGTTEVRHESDIWYESNERRLKMKEFATELSKLRGFSKMDKLSNVYFSMLLSGISTQELNTVSTFLQALGHTTSRAVAVHLLGSEGGRAGDLSGFFNTMGAFFQSFSKGIPEAWRMYRTGEAYGPAMSYYAFTKHPDRNPFTGKLERFGKIINLVQRGLQSADFLMAHANAVAFQRSKAHMDALNMGLRGEKLELAEKMFMALRWSSASRIDVTTLEGRKELEGLVNQFVGTDKYEELVTRLGLLDNFIDQAYFEITGQELDANNREAGIKKLNKEQKYLVYSRIDELQYNSLAPELRDDIKKNVGIGTFNIGEGDSDTYDNTWMGKLTSSVEHARKNLPQLVFVLPFVRIVGKVYDMSIDYSPWGFRRAQWTKKALAQQLADGTQSKLNETDIAILQVKAAIGSTIITSLFAMAIQSIMTGDDDDDWFQITGRGDPNRDKTNIMREGKGYGYQEYSVRIGRRWFTYRYSPLAIPFVLIGSMMDTLRYDIGIRSLRKLPADEREAMEMPAMKIAYKMFFTGTVNSLPGFLSQSYLSGAANFMEILSTPNDTVREQKAARFFGSLTTGMIVPNFLKQVERSIDPSLYETPDDMNAYVGAVLRDMPSFGTWKDNVLIKRHNALGEPIRLTSPSALFSLLEMTAKDRENKPHNLGRFVSTGQRSDPTWTWLADKNVSIRTPGTYELLMGLPMTDKMRLDYAIKRGKIVKNILDSVVTTHYFKNMSEREAQEFTNTLVSKVGRLVKTAMIADPKLVQTLIRKNRPEILKKYGIALPDHR